MPTSIRFDEIPGADVITYLPFSLGSPEGVVLLDLDDVLKPTRASGQQARFYGELRPITDKAGLKWEFVELAHNLEERERLRREGIIAIDGPEALFASVAAAMGDAFVGDEEVLFEAQLEYEKLVLSIENIPPYDGVRDELTRIRLRWPLIPLIGCTLCPRWLVRYRLLQGGILLDRLDGYVGIKHYMPAADGHRFARHIRRSHEWMDELEALTENHVKHHVLQVGMPGAMAKPDPTSLYALATWAKVSVDKVVMVDDNPLTGGWMAAKAGAVFGHAVWGCRHRGIHQDNWPAADQMASLGSIADLTPLLEAKFGPGVDLRSPGDEDLAA